MFTGDKCTEKTYSFVVGKYALLSYYLHAISASILCIIHLIQNSSTELILLKNVLLIRLDSTHVNDWSSSIYERFN